MRTAVLLFSVFVAALLLMGCQPTQPTAPTVEEGAAGDPGGLEAELGSFDELEEDLNFDDLNDLEEDLNVNF